MQGGITSAKKNSEMRRARWIHFQFQNYLALNLAWPKKRSSEAKGPQGDP